MNRLVLAELDVQPQHVVLEVGFGGGGLLAALLARSRHVVGVDISAAMLRRAERRFAGALEAGTLRLIHTSAETLPLSDASVDRIASVSSLYFWPKLDAAFRELARVMKPGGHLAIAWEPPEELRKWPGHVHGFRLVSEEDLRALLDGAGFEPLRCVEGRGRKPDRFLCLTARRCVR